MSWEQSKDYPFRERQLIIYFDSRRTRQSIDKVNISTPRSIIVSFQTLVLHPGDNLGSRVCRTDQGKAQSAGNGVPFARTATRLWSVWRAPLGPAGTRPSASLLSLDTQSTVSPVLARLAADCVLAECLLNDRLDGVITSYPAIPRAELGPGDVE